MGDRTERRINEERKDVKMVKYEMVYIHILIYIVNMHMSICQIITDENLV